MNCEGLCESFDDPLILLDFSDCRRVFAPFFHFVLFHLANLHQNFPFPFGQLRFCFSHASQCFREGLFPLRREVLHQCIEHVHNVLIRPGRRHQNTCCWVLNKWHVAHRTRVSAPELTKLLPKSECQRLWTARACFPLCVSIILRSSYTCPCGLMVNMSLYDDE